MPLAAGNTFAADSKSRNRQGTQFPPKAQTEKMGKSIFIKKNLKLFKSGNNVFSPDLSSSPSSSWSSLNLRAEHSEEDEEDEDPPKSLSVVAAELLFC